MSATALAPVLAQFGSHALPMVATGILQILMTPKPIEEVGTPQELSRAVNLLATAVGQYPDLIKEFAAQSKDIRTEQANFAFQVLEKYGSTYDASVVKSAIKQQVSLAKTIHTNDTNLIMVLGGMAIAGATVVIKALIDSHTEQTKPRPFWEVRR